MEPERTLTRRELNRALLARQLLLERDETTVAGALERLGGLQAQYAPSMYVGLWSRRAGFPRESLTRLLERRTVVQATLMRVTIHLVARRDFWPFALATRDARRRLWLTSQRDRLDEGDMAEAVELLRPRLADGPLKRTEIEQLVGKTRASGVGLWIDLVRAPPSGTWERRRADLYALAESWIGAPEVSVDDGVEHLVRRYLTGFGPASRTEIALYTGLSQRAIAPRSSACGCAGSAAREARSSSTSRAARSRPPTRRRPSASSPPGTQHSSCTPAGRASSPRSTARGSSPRRTHIRCPRSSSTARWPAPGGTRRAASRSSPSGASTGGTERELREEAERLAEFHA